MKKKLEYKQIKQYVGAVLILMLLGQLLWIYSVYHARKVELSLIIGQAAQKAMLIEGEIRYEQMGGTIVWNPKGLDTARYVTRTIRAIDTTFHLNVDMFDPHWRYKYNQSLLLHDQRPVNVQNLNRLFRQELLYYHFPLAGTAVEYIDIADGAVLMSSASADKNWIATDIIPVDTDETMGIRGYAELPVGSVLIRMIIPILLSALLMAICMSILYMVSRSFFWKDKNQKMRQDSVHAMLHEFKRPISAAVAQVSLIPHYMSKGNTDRVRKYGESIILELDRLTAYTDRVQTFNNNDKEHIVLNKEKIELHPFLDELMERYAALDNKEADLTLSIETEQTYIYADLMHLSNIMDNLIENAIKYSGMKLSICLSARDVEGRLCVSVRDNGWGMTQSDQIHIFDKYYRSDDHQVHRHVGYGLGLTYVKALVEAHEAKIEVKSKYGKGSEFLLYFPLG